MPGWYGSNLSDPLAASGQARAQGCAEFLQVLTEEDTKENSIIEVSQKVYADEKGQ